MIRKISDMTKKEMTFNQWVPGSIPGGRTNFFNGLAEIGWALYLLCPFGVRLRHKNPDHFHQFLKPPNRLRVEI